MRVLMTPFQITDKLTIEIEDFVPCDGMDIFLVDLCRVIDCEFLDWYQGIESGIGHIKYMGEIVMVIWNDFPLSIGFDFNDKKIAEAFKMKLEQYLNLLAAT